MRRKAILGITAIAGLASGCASVVSSASLSTYQSVSVQTQVQGGGIVNGASCEMHNAKGKWFATTPGTVMIRRSNDDLQVVCTKPGLGRGAASVVSETKGAIFGNIIAGGPVGAVIDHGSGSAYEYPESIKVVMGASSIIDASKAAAQPSTSTGSSSTLAAPDQDDSCKPYVLAAGERCWFSQPRRVSK